MVLRQVCRRAGRGGALVARLGKPGLMGTVEVVILGTIRHNITWAGVVVLGSWVEIDSAKHIVLFV